MSYYDTPSDQPDPNQPNAYGQGGPTDPYAQPGQGGGVVTRPPAMDRAVMLMKVGAGLSLLSLVLSLLFMGQVRDAIEQANADAGTTMTSDQIDAAVTVGVAVAVIFGLIGVGLWLWMASANGKGKSWARIVATVFFALSVLSFLFSLLQAQPLLTRFLGVVQVALGAYIIVLMYKKESSEFYRASSAPKY